MTVIHTVNHAARNALRTPSVTPTPTRPDPTRPTNTSLRSVVSPWGDQVFEVEVDLPRTRPGDAR